MSSPESLWWSQPCFHPHLFSSKYTILQNQFYALTGPTTVTIWIYLAFHRHVSKNFHHRQETRGAPQQPKEVLVVTAASILSCPAEESSDTYKNSRSIDRAFRREQSFAKTLRIHHLHVHHLPSRHRSARHFSCVWSISFTWILLITYLPACKSTFFLSWEQRTISKS